MKTLVIRLAVIALLWEAAHPVIGADGIFPDKNLEAVVRKYVFEKRGNQEPIVEEDVVNISTIVGKGKNIKDLTGLEKCRSLALLDLENNEIENIAAIKKLTSIKTLDLANNQIKNVNPLAGLTKLQILRLEHNQIEDISPLAELENMRSLYLSHNRIKHLKPIAKLTKMRSLFLADNQIEDISAVSALEKLEGLDLSKNQVAEIAPLKELTRWKWLFLGENKITDLKVLIEMGKRDKSEYQRFANSWHIYLSGNPLTNEGKMQLDELKQYAGRVDYFASTDAEPTSFASATRGPYSPPSTNSINGKSIGQMKRIVEELWDKIVFDKDGERIDYVVTLKTEAGDVKIELWSDVAPNHARSFIALARVGYFDGLIFHRVIPGFVIQGGCSRGTGTGGPGYCLKPEFNERPHERGVVSMARAQPTDSAGSQFFVCVKAAPILDRKYTVFGAVTSGMNVVDQIVAGPRDASDRPFEPVRIKSATVAVKGTP